MPAVLVAAPPTNASMPGPARARAESCPQAVDIRRTNRITHGVRIGTEPSRRRDFPRAQRVTSGRARRPTAPRRKPTAQHDEPAAERLGGERDRGPQERATAQDGLRVPRGRSHRRAHPRPDVRGGGAALGERHARQAGRPGEQAGARRRASWPSAPSGCPTQYFDGRARPNSVRWVTNQNTRWGSCTPSEGSIRLSHRLQGMPEYVVDYVLAPRAGASARPRARAPILAAAGGLSAHRAGPRLPRRGGRRRPAAAPARRARRVTRRTPPAAVSTDRAGFCTGSVPASSGVGVCR